MTDVVSTQSFNNIQALSIIYLFLYVSDHLKFELFLFVAIEIHTEITLKKLFILAILLLPLSVL